MYCGVEWTATGTWINMDDHSCLGTDFFRLSEGCGGIKVATENDGQGDVYEYDSSVLVCGYTECESRPAPGCDTVRSIYIIPGEDPPGRVAVWMWFGGSENAAQAAYESGTYTWHSAAEQCATLGGSLCTYEQICPDGEYQDLNAGIGSHGTFPAVYRNDNWAPYEGDGEYQWVQTGMDGGRPCMKEGGPADSWHGSSWCCYKPFICCDIPMAEVGRPGQGADEYVEHPGFCADSSGLDQDDTEYQCNGRYDCDADFSCVAYECQSYDCDAAICTSNSAVVGGTGSGSDKCFVKGSPTGHDDGYGHGYGTAAPPGPK
jgi:hypothetical protein